MLYVPVVVHTITFNTHSFQMHTAGGAWHSLELHLEGAEGHVCLTSILNTKLTHD